MINLVKTALYGWVGAIAYICGFFYGIAHYVKERFWNA